MISMRATSITFPSDLRLNEKRQRAPPSLATLSIQHGDLRAAHSDGVDS
jgi:hypothetical protein